MKRVLEKIVGYLGYDVVRSSKKRGIISEALPWILISIAILAIMMVALFVLKDKGVSIIDRIKDVFKFR